MNEEHQTLFDIAEDYRPIIKELIESDGEMPSDEFVAQLSKIQDAFDTKAVNCIHAKRNIEATIPAIDAEIKRLRQLKSVRQNAAQRLEDYVHDSMVSCKRDEIETDTMRIRIAKGPMSVQVVDIESVPVGFLRQPKPKVDKTAAKDYYKEWGEMPDGLVARDDLTRLSIK